MNSISSPTDDATDGWHVEVDDDGMETLVLHPSFVARLSERQKCMLRTVHEAACASLLPDWDDLVAECGYEALEGIATRRLHDAGADRG